MNVAHTTSTHTFVAETGLQPASVGQGGCKRWSNCMAVFPSYRAGGCYFQNRKMGGGVLKNN